METYIFLFFTKACLPFLNRIQVILIESEKFLTQNKVNKLEMRLLKHVKTVKPTLIVGVNKGGLLLSSFITVKMRFEADRTLICSVPIFDEEDCTIVSLDGSTVDNKDLDFSRVLFIDDVSRTGSSIERAIELVEKSFKDISRNNLYVATLVSTNHVDTLRLDINPNNYYTAFRTLHSDIRFPWHFEIDDPYIARVKTEQLAKKRQLENKRQFEIDKLLKCGYRALADMAVRFSVSKFTSSNNATDP